MLFLEIVTWNAIHNDAGAIKVCFISHNVPCGEILQIAECQFLWKQGIGCKMAVGDIAAVGIILAAARQFRVILVPMLIMKIAKKCI